jgi:hypothetical protein
MTSPITTLSPPLLSPEDDSPPPKFRTRRPVPSEVCPVISNTSPGSGADSPLPKARNRRTPVIVETPSPGPSSKKTGLMTTPSMDLRSPEPTNRQLMLNCVFLDVQATEDRNGVSLEREPNSSDDGRDRNCSNVTDGSYSDGDREVYLNSLGTQDSDSEFKPPLHHVRRKPFRYLFHDEI